MPSPPTPTPLNPRNSAICSLARRISSRPLIRFHIPFMSLCSFLKHKNSLHDLPMPFMTDDRDQRSLLVFLSARALGSLGFGLSVLAIWIGWIIPASPPSILASDRPRPAAPVDTKSRRRSAPSALPSQPLPPSPNPLPLVPTPILTPSPEDAAPNRARHVYFIDSDIRPSPLRRSTMPAYPSQLISDTIQPTTLVAPLAPVPLSTSPLSSTSTLINPGHSDGSPKRPSFEPCEEECVEFDSTQHSSRGERTSSRLPLMKITFHGKGRKNAAVVDSSSPAPVADSPKNENQIKQPVKRSNTVPWCSISRNKLNPNTIPETSRKASPSSRLSLTRRLTSRSVSSSPVPSPAVPAPPPATPTLTATPSPSSTSFFRKPQRRTSTPVRRTLPYEAPYFASPPLILEDDDRPEPRSSWTKPTSTASDNGHEFGVLGKDRDRKYASTGSKAAVAGRVPKRRSASADIAERSMKQ